MFASKLKFNLVVSGRLLLRRDCYATRLQENSVIEGIFSVNEGLINIMQLTLIHLYASPRRI